MKAGSAAKPRLLFVVSEDWYFLSHRLPQARAARDAGFEVHVATNVGDGTDAIAAERFILHPVPLARGRLSPLASLATIRALRWVYRVVAPDIIHHVSLQPAVLGSVAALGRRVACVNAINGLGYSFASTTAKAKAVQRIISLALRFLLGRDRMISVVQNRDDLALLTSLGVPKSRIALIQGSGVDVARLVPLEEPQDPPTIAFVGRLLVDKGIQTVVVAHRLLRERGMNVVLLIAGTPDPLNPTSVSTEQAIAWSKAPGVTWLGYVTDVAEVWRQAHIAVLPSRREGLPLSLLEAAACGRAMIATDVPGCREIVVADQTGLLVPCDDATALADAIERLFAAPELRQRFAAAARRLVVERFAADVIGPQTVALYRQLLDSKADCTCSPDGATQENAS